MAAKQRINIDLDDLFPGEELIIGKTIIIIRPLGLYQIATITKTLKGLSSILAEDGVTWDNYNSPVNFVTLATVLLEHFPSVLEEASNIDIEDIKQLPIDSIVALLDKIIQVNLSSKERLQENFKSLTEKLIKVLPKTPQKGGKKER